MISVTPPAGGGTPASYVVAASPGGASCTITPPATSCVISGLTNGQPYTFTVTATNGAGTTGSSTASTPVTPTAGGRKPQTQRPAGVPRKLRNPGATVVNASGSVTIQGQPLKAAVAAHLLRGDLTCLRVRKGPDRKVTTVLPGKCAMRIRVTYTAPGTSTLFPYSKTVTYKVKRVRR
jgi:hypothetical protein